MLNIGRALRNERLAQNKTQREWIKDVPISVSRYSEIENNTIKNGKKADIDSEKLILLLESNNVDVKEFFSNLQYKSTSIEKLSLEISQAFNNGNYKKASEVKRKIFASSNAPLSLKYRAILIVSELKDHMASLDQKTIDEIFKLLRDINTTADIPSVVNSLSINDKNNFYICFQDIVLSCIKDDYKKYDRNLIERINSKYSKKALLKSLPLIEDAYKKQMSNVNFYYILDNLMFNILKEKFLCK